MTTPSIDALLSSADAALRTLFATPHASRACPTLPGQSSDMSADEKALAGALMRVNHVGEVCAQALYASQALATRNAALRQHFQRLDELGAHRSLLNPLWYAGAFGLGLLAGRMGDRVSLGFVVETEKQVEAHLQGHMDRLPPHDHASRAIVAQMKDDEVRHAMEARQAGAVELPPPVKGLMRLAAKVMTTVAHRI
jgi:3-demethoxyubiquinol 3-hydroxylase